MLSRAKRTYTTISLLKVSKKKMSNNRGWQITSNNRKKVITNNSNTYKKGQTKKAQHKHIVSTTVNKSIPVILVGQERVTRKDTPHT